VIAMADNKIIEELKERIPQIKEGIDKVEDITGGKIQDIAQEIGGKITDAINENNKENDKGPIGDIANKLFGK